MFSESQLQVRMIIREEKKELKLTWQTDTISELTSGELLSLPHP